MNLLGAPASRRLAGGKALLDRPFRLAEQNRNVRLRVQAVADEKRDDDQVPGLRERITFANARAFFEKNRADGGINFHRPDQFRLPLDGPPRVFILHRAVAGDEQRDVPRLWRAGKGKSFHNFIGARQNDPGHAVVRADGLAIEQ